MLPTLYTLYYISVLSSSVFFLCRPFQKAQKSADDLSRFLHWRCLPDQKKIIISKLSTRIRPHFCSSQHNLVRLVFRECLGSAALHKFEQHRASVSEGPIESDHTGSPGEQKRTRDRRNVGLHQRRDNNIV